MEDTVARIPLTHYPFPEIDQFRETVKGVQLRAAYIGKDSNEDPIYDDSLPKPTLKFKGTVKLHGTNSSVVILKNGTIYYQSRERVIGFRKDDGKLALADIGDNSGFANGINKYATEILELVKNIEFNDYLVLFGEWCGMGIMKGVAINQLPKMFVLFAAKKDDEWFEFNDFNSHTNIYNISSFKSFEIDIDFNEPSKYLETLNQLTLEVEHLCPVAKDFGIEGTGEGIVWVSERYRDKIFRFKTKGEKHSLKATKVISQLEIDKYNDVAAFVVDNVPPTRLEQGLDYLRRNNMEIEIKNIAAYLKWMVSDILKECQPEIKENNLDEKLVSKKVMETARKFYMDYLNTNL